MKTNQSNTTMKVKVSKTMFREVMRDCKWQMKTHKHEPFCALYMGAKFNYFYALAKLNDEVEKRFDILKDMYDDFHRQANIEGWQPVTLATFE